MGNLRERGKSAGSPHQWFRLSVRVNAVGLTTESHTVALRTGPASLFALSLPNRAPDEPLSSRPGKNQRVGMPLFGRRSCQELSYQPDYNVNESAWRRFLPVRDRQSAQIIVDRDTNRSRVSGSWRWILTPSAQAADPGASTRKSHDGRLRLSTTAKRVNRGVGGGAAMSSGGSALARRYVRRRRRSAAAWRVRRRRRQSLFE